jgi:hypothetical protein
LLSSSRIGHLKGCSCCLAVVWVTRS